MCLLQHPSYPACAPEAFATPHGAAAGKHVTTGALRASSPQDAREALAGQSREGRCSGGTGDRKRRLTAYSFSCEVPSRYLLIFAAGPGRRATMLRGQG